MRAYNFVCSGRNLTKLYRGMWLISGVITWTVILEGVPIKKFWRVKDVLNSAQFVSTSRNFTIPDVITWSLLL